jgi:hypothetical protein
VRLAVFIFAACVWLVPSARADGMDEPAPPRAPVGGWSYQFTPYGWLPWLSGDAVIDGRAFKVAANPAQILENTEMVWMSYMQAKNGPLTLYTDIMYGDLGSSKSLLSSASRAGATLAIGAAVSADYQFWTIEFGGMYEIMKWRTRSHAASPDTVLELIAGGRYWRQQLDVNIALAGTASLDGLTVSGNTALASAGVVEWVDPLIGARLRYVPAPGEEMFVRGDVGGFGAGSKFSWQLLAAYNWFLYRHDSLTLDGYVGYRALSVNYSDGSGTDRYVYDVVQQGPVVGVTGRF